MAVLVGEQGHTQEQHTIEFMRSIPPSLGGAHQSSKSMRDE